MFHWPPSCSMPECITEYGRQVNLLVLIPGNQFVWFYMASIAKKKHKYSVCVIKIFKHWGRGNFVFIARENVHIAYFEISVFIFNAIFIFLYLCPNQKFQCKNFPLQVISHVRRTPNGKRVNLWNLKSQWTMFKCTGFFLFRKVDYASWLCCDTSNLILSFIGSTLSLCLQDGSNCRQRSLLCLWACLFRNSFNRTESTHHGPKLCTWKERRFVSKEHPKVSNGMLTEFPNNSIYWFQPLLQLHESWNIVHCCINMSVLLENTPTLKIHMKPHLELRWSVFHILTSEDIDDFTDIIVILMSSEYQELSHVSSKSRLDVWIGILVRIKNQESAYICLVLKDQNKF